jgi:effector-binding domain-containing protein
MAIEIAKKKLEPVTVVSIRTKTSLSDISKTISESYGRIYGYLKESGAECAGPPLTLYHDTEWNPEDIDIEPAAPVAKSVDVPEGMVCRELPGEEALITVHKGPYSTLKDTYTEIEAYMKENGLQYAGAVREVYLTDPDKVEKPEDNLTEIQIPFRSK